MRYDVKALDSEVMQLEHSYEGVLGSLVDSLSGERRVWDAVGDARRAGTLTERERVLGLINVLLNRSAPPMMTATLKSLGDMVQCGGFFPTSSDDDDRHDEVCADFGRRLGEALMERGE